jgi:hypothetical protein
VGPLSAATGPDGPGGRRGPRAPQGLSRRPGSDSEAQAAASGAAAGMRPPAGDLEAGPQSLTDS